MAVKPGEMFTHGAGLTFGGGTAGAGPPKIEHRIGVQAPADVIWEILADIPGWAAWNPLYPQAEGQLRIGGVLTLTVAIPGEPQRVIRPTIIDWVPRDQIHWGLSMMGGLVRSVRYLEIEILGETNCIFSNGEVFGGLLGPTVANAKRKAIRKGFTAMGEALAARAEAAWRARGETPTSQP
ncbi:MAG TPA: SRPBCC domain-containing protein [Phenylobacterium sp.]|nr:SRPBCC domain-containing protein [Phenylobacterium sp.]